MKVVELEDMGERFAEQLHAARAGEILVVVHRGEPIADVRMRVAVADESEARDSGGERAQRRFSIVPNDPRVYRLWPPLCPGVSSAELLDEERGER